MPSATFANPLYLVGLAGAALPLLIHLLTRDRVQRVVFPSLRFFVRTARASLVRRRFEEMLLIALRCVVCALLAVAFANPLFARDAVAAGDRVAAPVNTSMAVDAALEPLGASIARTRVGDVFVADRLAEPDAVFGGEPSGAWIWPGETRCPDGPLAACRLADLVARGGSLSDQLAEIEIFPLVRESIAVDRKATVMDRVSARIEDDYPTTDVSTIDGVRVGFDDGWFLIRASGTQPLIRITAEARDEDRAAALATEARQLVEDERT